MALPAWPPAPAPAPLATFLEGYGAAVLLYRAGATGQTDMLLGPAVIRPVPCPVIMGLTLAKIANN